MARRSAGRRRAGQAAGARVRRGELLQQGLALHQAGRLAEAEAAYGRFLRHNPGHGPCLHNLGLLQHACGRREQALATLRQAVQASPGDVASRNNLANLLREAGLPAEAVAVYREALAIEPGHLNARYNLATALHDLQDLPGAIAAYREVLADAPGDAAVWSSLGRALLDSESLDEAEECLRRALELQPGYPTALLNLGTVRSRKGDWQGAVRTYREALAARGDFAEAHSNLAAVLREHGDLDEAAAHCREALRLRPRYVYAWYNLGNVRFNQERLDAAAQCFRKCLELDPEHADAWCQLGSALITRANLDEGLEALRESVRLRPDSAPAWSALGAAYLQQGDMPAARESLDRALALDPDLPEAWLTLSRSRRFGGADRDLIERAAGITQRRELGDRPLAALSFALGKMHDDCGDYARAFESYRRGNALIRKNLDFDAGAHEQRCADIISVFSAQMLAAAAGWGDPSPLPVFVFGMPRSGTTLVEQILASHPRVHGGGELPWMPELSLRLPAALGASEPYPRGAAGLDRDTARRFAGEYLARLRALDAGADRITDKLPGNFMHLGLISALLPGAKLVYCRRNPMDTCLSNYVQQFAEGHHYAYDLNELGRMYRSHLRLMAHWRRVLAPPVLEVSYEALVSDTERVSREMIAFCGLPWDERCLAFNENRRAVSTASNWQVRQPIYRSAVERWRRYEPWLGELRQALEEDPVVPGDA